MQASTDVTDVREPMSWTRQLLAAASHPGSGLAVAVGLSIAALVASRFVEGYTAFILTTAALNVVVGVGLNILLGLSGQISFGHVGFFAIGAYTTGILTSIGYGFWPGFVAAGLLTGAIGALLAVPALRVTGPYLAMVTIAFAFIIEHGAIEWRELTGGANGLMAFDKPEVFGHTFSEEDLASFAVVVAGLALVLFWRLRYGGWGVAMRAVRDSEIAAQSVGLDPLRLKATSFILSAVLAGLAGGIFTPLNGFISPGSFPFSQSILFILAVVVGGSGTILGPVVGAAIVVLLPEFLADMAEYRLLLFGALLLGVLWAAPRGVVGSITRWFDVEDERVAKPSGRHLADILGRDESGRQSLEVNGLSRAFGGIKAASDVSFTAAPGQVTSIIGPNGAGKTTVLNLVSGFYVPDAGSIRLGDAELSGQPAHQVSRAGIARTYQTTHLFGELSVLDNVLIALRNGRLGHLLSRNSDDDAVRTAEDLLAFVGYRGPLARQASALPHVDRRLVEIARALATQPRVLLLDEPAAGLAMEDKAALARLLREIGDVGITVILVEHDMSLVMDVSDHIVVLDGGELLSAGLPAEIQQDAAVRDAYLGSVGYEGKPRGEPWAGEHVAVLTTLDLSAGYGAAPAIDGVDLVVNPGEMVAVLGANGAGKSTLMRAISGLHRPVQGSVILNDQQVGSKPAHEIVAAGLALVPEGRQVFPELTARDNVMLGAFRRGSEVSAADIDAVIDRFPRLRARLDSKAGVLSGGEQQMLAIARALVSEPKILLLDEPSLGLAPAIIGELYDLLAELRDEGVTILLVDQMANLALTIVDRGYVLSNGRVAHEGSADELKSQSAVVQAYLGGSAEAARQAE
jgi:branched-chain amino acid transport system ATP-binding protein